MSGRTESQNIGYRVSATFDLDARFPGQVFRNNVGKSLFCEFDAVLTPDFWPALSAMARWHGDDHVDLLVLPDGGELPERSAVSLPVEASEDDYWASIGFEPDGDALGSIAIAAKVVAVTGRSGKWGCWGERGPEIAVFRGFPSDAARDEWRDRFGPFLEARGALRSYLPPTFAGRIVPDEYAASLTSNYGTVG
ncbi:hypothetical protein ACFWMR_34825 [Amycolatopsis thailandensis]|uniref:hypothetical protein n=1 Tax=Amycolatopsis thailandensis TaxID=589330 RepID=UPI003646353C